MDGQAFCKIYDQSSMPNRQSDPTIPPSPPGKVIGKINLPSSPSGIGTNLCAVRSLGSFATWTYHFLGSEVQSRTFTLHTTKKKLALCIVHPWVFVSGEPYGDKHTVRDSGSLPRQTAVPHTLGTWMATFGNFGLVDL